jgi:hypothetical protein
MLLIMKILEQFKVPFSLLHDSDRLFRSDGRANGAWTANLQLYEMVRNIRAGGTRVVHRISIPSFEYAHLQYRPVASGLLVEFPEKEKPWGMVNAIREDPEVRQSVRSILRDLVDPAAQEWPHQGDFEEYLEGAVSQWARENCPKDPKFFPQSRKGETELVGV